MQLGASDGRTCNIETTITFGGSGNIFFMLVLIAVAMIVDLRQAENGLLFGAAVILLESYPLRRITQILRSL